MADREMMIAHAMHRRSEFDCPGSTKIVFTEIDDVTGVERWETGEPTNGQSRRQISEAARWQKIMRWPIEPDIETVMAFKANASARAQAALFYALQPEPPAPVV
jgi:hypothetical protein